MKPVVTVFLLPSDWDEEKLKAFHADLVEVMKEGLHYVNSEDDVITLFPSDLMKKGLGTEIHIVIDLFETASLFNQKDDWLARSMVGTVRRYLSWKASIQCKINKRVADHGCWSS